MRKKKLILSAIALFAMVGSVFSQKSLAYYSTVGKATNVVTSGNIKFVIHETPDQGTPFPSDGVYVMPGDVVSKQVTIENICDQPFYLRVKVVNGIDSDVLDADDCFKLNINDEYWKYKDGWFYYQGIVDPNETTPYVFSEVEIIGDKVDNDYIGKTLSLSVVAHAVQSAHNPITDNDISSAKGWPKE